MRNSMQVPRTCSAQQHHAGRTAPVRPLRTQLRPACVQHIRPNVGGSVGRRWRQQQAAHVQLHGIQCCRRQSVLAAAAAGAGGPGPSSSSSPSGETPLGTSTAGTEAVAAAGTAPSSIPSSPAVDTTAPAASSPQQQEPLQPQPAAAAAETSQGARPSSSPPGGASTAATGDAATPAAAAEPPGPAAQLLSRLEAVWAQLLAAWTALLSRLTSLPAWVSRQRLATLAAAAEAAPGDAAKQAAYCAALVKSQPAEVVARVDSGKYAVNPAVVVEYITALVASRQLEQYKQGSTPAAAGSSSEAAEVKAAADGAALVGLLGRLQAAAAGGAGAGLGAERLGGSSSRPLHVVLQGVGVPASAAGARGASAAATRPLSPVGRLAAAVWSLVMLGVSLVLLAALYLVGRQTWRALAAGSPLSGGEGAASSVVAPSAGAGGGSGPGGLSTSGGGAFDPKEYKKEELPEASVKTFADVKGCTESKAELQEVVEFLKNPAKFTRLGAKLPRGILLTGPPGTGKTLLAKAVAGEAGVPFFYRAGSEFEELYVGVGSRRMRALFAAAKKRAPCIVFIDEIDAIGGNRKHWENHTRKTLNQLLVEMDGFEANEGVIVMAATNLPETLDPALKRPGRFDRQVAVPLPDVAGRREMLEYYLGDKPVAPDVDATVLARNTPGFSGADISNLVNEAALLAAKSGADQITGPMLDWAYDKVMMGVERLSAVRSPEARRRTAYHEGGHALVAASVAGASPLHKATIIPRGHALGMVTQMGRDDEYSISRQQMMARILVALGGTVAEELIFGREGVTSGATDDLRQATEMARHMVMQCGLSEAVGPLYVADEKGLSESLKQAVDDEVRGMLMEARTNVKSLLTQRLEDLHRLAGALLEHETLTAPQIKAVLAGELLLPGSTSSSSSGGGTKVPEPVGAPDPELEGN